MITKKDLMLRLIELEMTCMDLEERLHDLEKPKKTKTTKRAKK